MAAANPGVGHNNEPRTVFISTSNGGATWTLLPQWSSTALAVGLVCVSVTTCFAPGRDDVAMTTNAGRTWRYQRQPRITTLYGVSCPSASTCFSIGTGASGLQIDRDGPTRATVAFRGSSAANQPMAISCPSIDRCMAVGSFVGTGDVLTTADGGKSWSGHSLPSWVAAVFSASCVASGECFLVASRSDSDQLVALSSTTGGKSWMARGFALSPGGLAADDPPVGNLSCPAAGRCLAVGYYTPPNQVYVGVGSHWSHTALPDGSQALSAVACSGPSACVAVGWGDAAYSDDGGASWASASPLPPSTYFLGAACATPLICIATGRVVSPSILGSAGGPLIYRSTDGGEAWEPVTLPLLPTVVHSVGEVACPTATECVALAGSSTSLYTTDAGQTWTVVTAANPHVSLYSLSCGSAVDCVAVGSDNLNPNDLVGIAEISSDGGQSWGSPIVVAEDFYYLQAVSCVAGGSCWAVAYSYSPTYPYEEPTLIYESTDGGETWATTLAAPSDPNGSSIACFAVSCEVIADELPPGHPETTTLAATSDSGTAWTDVALPDASDFLSASTTTSSGTWLNVGESTRNGALILTG